jgi:hypothetical protein
VTSLDTYQRAASIAYVIFLPRIVSRLDSWCSLWRSQLSLLLDELKDSAPSVTHTWSLRALILRLYMAITRCMKTIRISLQIGISHAFPYLKALSGILSVVHLLLYTTDTIASHSPFFLLSQTCLAKPSPVSIPNTSSSNSNVVQSPSTHPRRFFNMSYTAFIVLLSRLVQWHQSNDQYLSSFNISNVCKKSERKSKKSIPFPHPPPAKGKGHLLINPREGQLCALCGEERTNPCAASSGYVFCYGCVLPVVRRSGRCPVTDMPCREDQLIRLFEESSLSS